MSDEKTKTYLEQWAPELAGCAGGCLCESAECLGKAEEVVVSQVLVKFERSRKVARATHGQLELEAGDRVVVETDRGTGVAVVITPPNRALVDRRNLRRVLKRLGRAEPGARERLREKEQEAFALCQQHVLSRDLPMRLVAVEFLAGETRAIFYFSAEGRVDFRELVRALARDLRARIEMRQIGVRDQAKMVGGLGLCGRELCCASFLRGFDPVTIKMAKIQGLVLNPQKVSGQCGRLLCCLAYEYEQYRESRKGLPKVGAQVETPAGPGRVREVDILRRRVRVAVEGQPLTTYPVEEIARPGERPLRVPEPTPPAQDAEPTPATRPPRPAPTPRAEGDAEAAESRQRRRRGPQAEGAAPARREATPPPPRPPREQGAAAGTPASDPAGEKPQEAPGEDGETPRRRSRRGGRRRRGRGKEGGAATPTEPTE